MSFDLTISTPSLNLNFTPRMTFGNWLWPRRRFQLFSAACAIVDHGESGLAGKASPRSDGLMPHDGERALDRICRAQMFLVFGRKVVEGEQWFTILL